MSADAADERTGGRAINEALGRIERAQTIRRALGLIGLVALGVTTLLGLWFIFEGEGPLVAVLAAGFEELAGQFGTWVGSLEAFLSPDFVDFTGYSKQEQLTGLDGLFGSLANPSTLAASLIAQQGIVGASVVTVVIGFTGTVIGFPLALLFGVLGSERVTPFPFNFLFRGTMSTIRAVPALVWILIYIPLAGISPVSATLAIATDTIGNLGRLFTDELEEIDEGPIEAISSTGAARSQVVAFGMLSQVSTSFIAWTLYILEINVRIAISLGVVGAGGIGQYINLRIDLFEFSQAAAGIIMVIFIVLSVELTSSRLRAYLRPSEETGGGLLSSIRDLANPNKWLGTGDPRR